jgi:RNase H-like domain found in reverse transcriptase
LVDYYRKFIKGYGEIIKPLPNLLKKNKFHWNTEVAGSFAKLKTALSTAPMPAMSNFTQPFILKIYASDMGLGAMLV